MGIIRNAIKAGIEAAAGAGNDTKSPAAPPSYQAPTGAAPGYIADPEAGKTTGAYTDSTAYPAKPSPAAYPGAGDGEQPGRKRKAHRGIRGKSMLVIGMLFEPALRHAHSLAAVTIWGVTLLIIGIVFLILVLTGTYPASVAEQKYFDIYAVDIAKYCIYIGAAIMGVGGCSIGRRALRAGNSASFSAFVLWVTAVVTLATIGISGYIIYKDTQLDAAWWSYLISALIIIERIIYILACSAAAMTLKEGSNDREVAAVVVDSPVML